MARELEATSRRGTRVAPPGTVLLSVGEPDFATPAHIQAALVDALAQGATHYAAPFGDPDLRLALADAAAAVAGRGISADQAIVTHGAHGGIGAVMLATLDPGDRVVIPDPNYSLYADHVRLAGAVPVFVPCLTDHHLDLDALERAAAGARMVILCHPCNPTGAVLTGAELAEVARIAEANDLLVLADEAYDAMVYERPFISSLTVEALAPRLLYCQTFSKRYAMTGWRIGWLVVPPDLAPAIGRIHFSLHGPLNSAVQRAALAALGSTDDVDRMVREYARRRDLVVAGLAAMPGVTAPAPEGTFYAFLRYPQHMDAVSMLRRCLDHGVALRAGSEFGDAGENHLRLSFAAGIPDLEEGLRRLGAALAS